MSALRPTAVEGVRMWSAYQPDRAMDFNSWHVRGDGGAFVVDPLPLSDDGIEELRALGVDAIVVTNRDHERAAGPLAEALHAPIFASVADAELLSVPVANRLESGDSVFGWRALVLQGAKTPGEFVLYNPAGGGTAIVGDVLWGDPVGSLRIMPEEKLADPMQAVLGLRFVWSWKLNNLLLGDGAPIFGNAHTMLTKMFEARTDVLVSRINFDELPYRDARDPADAPFGCDWVEIGQRIGAERLGYAAAKLRPGESFCPLHWHTREEELYLVWDGTPTLRTPQGTFALRRGDIVAFPARASGAHRLENHSDAECTVFMLAALDPGDVCFYPDSNKHVVEATDTMVRNEPQLDYYDGELPART